MPPALTTSIIHACRFRDHTQGRRHRVRKQVTSGRQTPAPTSEMTTPAAGPGRAATIVRTKPADGDLNDRVFLDAQLTAEAISRSGLAVAQVDLATQRLVAVSDSVAALLGSDRPELLGRLVSDFVDGEPTGALPLLATGRLDGFEAPRRLRRLDGSIIDA